MKKAQPSGVAVEKDFAFRVDGVELDLFGSVT
jgi:hypothetical protein